MNIFEQYGIKEVADCTLYAIELDKYDDEIYIPVLYFDTLKISTLEQTAEQTSARGGLGNPELIVWDYNKEITVTLEDALYTPASQSLMWGAKFGTKHSKIYGVWNPYVYEKDRYGKTLYLKPNVRTGKPLIYYNYVDAVAEMGSSENFHSLNGDTVSGGDGWYALNEQSKPEFYVISNAEPDQVVGEPLGTTLQEYNETNSTDYFLSDGYIEFICPCDEQKKYVKYEPNTGHYKYTKKEDKTVDQLDGNPFNCPKDKIVYENGQPMLKYYEVELNKNIWDNKKRPEMAEITIDNFGKFNYKTFKFAVGESAEDTSNEDACHYEEIDDCGGVTTNELCTGDIESHGYYWDKTDIKMTSLEGNQDAYYNENVSVRYRVPIDSVNKEIMIARQGLFDSSAGQEDLTVENEILNYDDVDTEIRTDGKAKYQWQTMSYGSKVDFYLTVTWTVPTVKNGTEMDYSTRVKVGTFYIIDDWNTQSTSPQELIYPINSGLENVYNLDRMEKCKATQTFAINTDNNLRLSNYRYMPEYAEAEITVFIDPKTMKPYEPNTDHFNRKNGQIVEGNLRIIKQHEIYCKWTRSKASQYTSLGHQIVVDAKTFPGVYRLVGETYSRSRDDGKDQRFQFEIPLCKMASDTNLTLEAAGDPTTFTMNMRVLRRDDGVMMKLTQYDVVTSKYDGYCSGSTEIISTDMMDDGLPVIEDDNEVVTTRIYTGNIKKTTLGLEIVSPSDGDKYFVSTNSVDPFTPYYGEQPYITPLSDSETVSEENLNRSQLLIKRTYNTEKEYYDETTIGDKVVDRSELQWEVSAVEREYLTESDIESITTENDEITINIKGE